MHTRVHTTCSLSLVHTHANTLRSHLHTCTHILTRLFCACRALEGPDSWVLIVRIPLHLSRLCLFISIGRIHLHNVCAYSSSIIRNCWFLAREDTHTHTHSFTCVAREYTHTHTHTHTWQAMRSWKTKWLHTYWQPYKYVSCKLPQICIHIIMLL